jgi:hypothetical protein
MAIREHQRFHSNLPGQRGKPTGLRVGRGGRAGGSKLAVTTPANVPRRFLGAVFGLAATMGCSGVHAENYDAPIATATGFIGRVSAKRTTDQADVGDGCSLYWLGNSRWPGLASPSVEQVTVRAGDEVEVENRFFEIHKRRSESNTIGNRDDSYWCSTVETSSERPFAVGKTGTYECLALAPSSAALVALNAVNEILQGAQDVVGYQVSWTAQKSGTVAYVFDAACLGRRGLSAADVGQVPRVAQELTVEGS